MDFCTLLGEGVGGGNESYPRKTVFQSFVHFFWGEGGEGQWCILGNYPNLHIY